MTNPLDRYLHDVLVDCTVGGDEGADRLIAAALADDLPTVCALLDDAEHYALVNLVARLVAYSMSVAEHATALASQIMVEMLTDMRDHGGTLDMVIATLALGVQAGAVDTLARQTGGNSPSPE